jgi:uncharacterized protein (TIGR03545 family)
VKRILRIWGAAVFIALTVLLISIWIVFADFWVKRSIEISVGTALNTSLDIDHVHLSLRPLRIELNNLQVADRAVENQNRYEVDSVLFDIDANELLRHKVIINSIYIKNLRLHTERSQLSGSEKVRSRKRLNLPTINIPDVKEIIESEGIKSPEKARILSAEMREDFKQLKNDLSNLPEQSDLEQQRRKVEKLIEQIKKGGITTILTRSNEINDLSKSINTNINEINKVYTETNALITKIKQNKEILQNQIHEDISQVKNKYGDAENVVVSISSMIFSDKVHSQFTQALFWYQKFEPFLNRAVKRLKNGLKLIDKKGEHGSYIHYREKDPKPDFYIKSVSLSMYHSLGYLTGQLLDLTSDQSISMRPTTLKFSGKDLEAAELVELTGVFNRISFESIADTFAIKISGLSIRDLRSQLSEDLSIILTNADADIDGNITHNGEKLSGSIDVRFLNAHWNVKGVNGSKIIFELQSMLEQISSFQLKINISGNIDSTRIKITSDLDSVLGEIVRERINTTLVRFEKELNKEFELQLDNWLAESDLNIKELGKLQADLLSRIRDHRDVLKQIIF